MKLTLIIALFTSFAAPAAFAEGDVGDPTAGKRAFSQCQACHVVVDGDGNTLAGRRSRTGPNLFGMIGMQAGTVEGFRYSAELVEAGEQGLIWDEETFVAYSLDPVKFLRAFLDDRKARGKMTFKVRKSEDAVNLYAFIKSVSPSAEQDSEGN